MNRTREWFETPYRLGEKEVSGRFVVPSGIRCTHASTIARCFQDVPSIGVITTKSISLLPRAGYREPIFAQYAEGSYINAVGLTNPGASAFRVELGTVDIPADKFVLVSIFGASVSDFVEAARILEPVADGFELNMSCPHAKGYGAEIGADRALLCDITRAVVAAVHVPVFVKFSAILEDLAGAAAAVIAEGASGITVTNTIGPALVKLGDTPVLRNGLGGLSGDGIRPLGVRAVMQTRAALGPAPVIIGMGGISNHHHIQEYASVGADLFGVGSATAWLDSREYAQYFSQLLSGVIGSPAAESASQVSNAKPRIEYFDSRLESREEISEDLFQVSFTDLPAAYLPGSLAGKFFFIMLPGVGEKPFAVFSAAERSVIVRTVGVFTEQLRKLEVGSKLFLRGPTVSPCRGFGTRRSCWLGAALARLPYSKSPSTTSPATNLPLCSARAPGRTSSASTSSGPLAPCTSLPMTKVLALEGTHTRRSWTWPPRFPRFHLRILSSSTAGPRRWLRRALPSNSGSQTAFRSSDRSST